MSLLLQNGFGLLGNERKKPRLLWRGFLLCVLCIVLSGCTTLNADHVCPLPFSEQNIVPPSRARLIALAQQEWQFFGEQTLEVHHGVESMPRVGIWEDDTPQHVERIQNYWCTAENWRVTRANVCTRAWSAVFISWLMQQTGVPEAVFPRHIAHWQYLRHIFEHQHLAEFPFYLHGISEYAPKVGDLICAARGGHQLLSATELWRIPMHCDVVVEVNTGFIFAIGGNVKNSVTRVRLARDQSGFLQRELGGRSWVFVVENRYPFD